MPPSNASRHRSKQAPHTSYCERSWTQTQELVDALEQPVDALRLAMEVGAVPYAWLKVDGISAANKIPVGLAAGTAAREGRADIRVADRRPRIPTSLSANEADESAKDRGVPILPCERKAA